MVPKERYGHLDKDFHFPTIRGNLRDAVEMMFPPGPRGQLAIIKNKDLGTPKKMAESGLPDSTHGKGAAEDRPVVWYAVATCLLGRFPHAGDDERDHRKVREPCVWRRVDDRKDHLGLCSSVHPTSEKEHYRREPDLCRSRSNGWSRGTGGFRRIGRIAIAVKCTASCCGARF